MAKAFLCHSSVQKPLLRKVISFLDEGSYEYDEKTFESGVDVGIEIERTTSSSDIIVLFISSESLESPWVQKEMKLAEDKYRQYGRHTTLAFLVDERINYSDARIPEWLRKNLILRHIYNPKIIAAKIKHSLRESLNHSSDLYKSFNNIFIGRNDKISEFETHHYFRLKENQLSLIISGFEGVGRRSFLIEALKHVGLIPPTISEMALFYLSPKNSIEDLITQLENIEVEFDASAFINVLNLSQDEKVDYAIKKINEYLEFNETICIIDDRCIVKPNHSIAPWFKKLVESPKILKKYGLNVVSRYIPNEFNDWPHPLVHIHLEELNKNDQIKLFNYLISRTKIELQEEQSEFIYKILKGFPDLIKYVVQLLIQHRFEGIKNSPKLIQNYFDNKIANAAKTFLDDQDTRDLLILLSQLDCVSEKTLFQLVPDNKNLIESLSKLYVGSAIERTGVSGELIKISEAIGDYVKRSKIQLNPHYQQKLRKNIRESISSDGEVYATDSAELLINIRALLKSGGKLNAKYYIPSFVLQAIVELYNSRKFKSILSLAEVVLERKNQDLDIEYQIRYYLCQSLAHLQKESKNYETQFFHHLSYIEGADYNFLKGFFYRISKKDPLAQREFEEAIRKRNYFPKAQRELVTVLLGQDKPLEALKWAKSNYEEEPTNPYQIHAYFQCLILGPNPNLHDELLQKLLVEIKNSITNKAQSFYSAMQGQYLWIIKDKRDEAIKLLEEQISRGDKLYAPKALHRLAVAYGMTALANSLSKHFENDDLAV